MLKKLFAIIICFAIIATSAVGVCAFEDVSSSPYEDAIGTLAEMGLVKGASASEFQPNRTVTRQEMALFIARLRSGLAIDDSPDTENKTIFTDLVDSTFNAAISFCYDLEIVNGKGGTVFDPLGAVTVQEALTMAVRALGQASASSGLSFPTGYINKANMFGLMNNLDGVDYEAPMTRGQVAQLIYNTLYCDDLVYRGGTNFADTLFSEVTDVFSVRGVKQIKDNFEYECRVSRNGTDIFKIKKVSFLGYTGEAEVEMMTDGVFVYTVKFHFPVMGYVVFPSDAPPYVAESAAKLSASEAEKLMVGIYDNYISRLGFERIEPTFTQFNDNITGNVYLDTARNNGKIKYDYSSSKIGKQSWFNVSQSWLVFSSFSTGRLEGDVLLKIAGNQKAYSVYTVRVNANQ